MANKREPAMQRREERALPEAELACANVEGRHVWSTLNASKEDVSKIAEVYSYRSGGAMTTAFAKIIF